MALIVSLFGVSFITLIFTAIILLIALIVLGLVMIRLTATNKVPEIRRFESEKTYKDPNKNNATYSFPFMDEEGSVDLSVVVPAYNEEERMPIMLDEALSYLKSKKKSNPSFTYEILIVDDGSKDNTTEIGLQYVKKYGISNFRVLTLAKNRGKGGAVRLGVLSSRGRKILMVDADGATKFADLSRLDDKLNEVVRTKGVKSAIIVGSRAHLQEEAVAQRSLLRNFLMYGFHFLVWFLCVKGVKDTQCGFKLFTRPAAFLTFTALHVERWAFDVELLYIAQQLDIHIEEVAVNWTEIDGSKMIPFWSWLQMGKDLLLIRLRYVLNAWQIDPVKLKTQ